MTNLPHGAEDVDEIDELQPRRRRPRPRAEQTEVEVRVAGRLVQRTALTIIAAPPVMITQRNCESALGLQPRMFLSLAREYARAGGVVTSAGKARGVATEPFVDFMRRRGPGALEQVDEPTITPAETDTERLARELGLSAAPKPPARPALRLAANRAANSDDRSLESSAGEERRGGSHVPCDRKAVAR